MTALQATHAVLDPASPARRGAGNHRIFARATVFNEDGTVYDRRSFYDDEEAILWLASFGLKAGEAPK